MASQLPEEPAPSSDAGVNGRYHFLDVGGVKYGECILVEFGELRVLIDGSHQQDFKGQRGYSSIPDQLQQILGGQAPFDITLVVVTHCHADHVGCLPDLVSNGVIKPRFALLTDPKLGFGRSHDEDVVEADAAHPGALLAALLREEDATDLDDAELDDFIDAVATVESRYNQFVRDLRSGGTDVSLHRGQDLKAELATLLAPTGITLLGPSQDQLGFCAEQIATTNKDAEDAAADLVTADVADIARLYRDIVAADDPVDFRNPRGNGMNCQSITFAFGPPDARVLLAGDMQFAEPGVAGMDGEVRKLRQAVIAAGPYKLFKTTHHTSHNGQDDAFLDALGSPPLIVHSGGLRDESHPFPRLLNTLKARRGIRFARTDHNGLITAQPRRALSQALTISRGALNDFTPNVKPDEPEGGPELPVVAPPPPPPEGPAVTPVAGNGPQIIIVNLPPGPIDMSVAGVEIQVRVPRDGGQVRNIDVRPRPDGPGGQQYRDPSVNVAPGRNIDRLLFVTDSARLAANVGRDEARAALAGIAAGGGELIDGSGSGLADQVRKRLTRAGDRDGIVLLGGYDVVPPARRDVLSPALRQRLGANVGKDADQFWVWSDSSFGDLDGDAIAEVPVSRVPDGRDSRLFLSALTASALQLSDRFGIHNIARPFAAEVWKTIKGGRAMNVCEMFAPKDVVDPDISSPCHYYMLHGSDSDARQFVGEDRTGTQYPLAFDITRVPLKFKGMVFSGCCWGALIVKGKALDHVSTVPAPRIAEESIALAYLKAGAVAFIGCTGSHYSGPSTDPDENYAFRLHSAFWTNLLNTGGAPARALFLAKREYARSIVDHQGRLDPLDTARRLKNLGQFTCLGLGW